MINSTKNTDIDDIPFGLHYGDYKKLAEKYLSPIDKSTRNKYIRDLHELQKVANEASKEYQQAPHDKRVKNQDPLSKNKYQEGGLRIIN